MYKLHIETEKQPKTIKFDSVIPDHNKDALIIAINIELTNNPTFRLTVGITSRFFSGFIR